MAHVTRCPYCGTVWLLPDAITAERGPVKCAECRHSFDATCDMLEVPDNMFPDQVPQEQTDYGSFPPSSAQMEQPGQDDGFAGNPSAQSELPEPEPAASPMQEPQAPARRSRFTRGSSCTAHSRRHPHSGENPRSRGHRTCKRSRPGQAGSDAWRSAKPSADHSCQGADDWRAIHSETGCQSFSAAPRPSAAPCHSRRL